MVWIHLPRSFPTWLLTLHTLASGHLGPEGADYDQVHVDLKVGSYRIYVSLFILVDSNNRHCSAPFKR